MKQLFLSFALPFICFSVNAQSARQHADPNTGSFYVTKNSGIGKEKINVNYVLSPGIFTNVLNISMNTPDPMLLSYKLVDGKGKELINWMPSQKSDIYDHEFDISNLKPGKYYVNVYDENNNKVQVISFEKSANTINNTNVK